MIDITEDNTNLTDIFGFGKEPEPVRIFFTARFGHDDTFDEDLIKLKKRWKGTDNEVLINHMIDSLILFNHNRKYIGDVSTGDKFGDIEVRKAIQIQSPRKE